MGCVTTLDIDIWIESFHSEIASILAMIAILGKNRIITISTFEFNSFVYLSSSVSQKKKKNLCTFSIRFTTYPIYLSPQLALAQVHAHGLHSDALRYVSAKTRAISHAETPSRS